MVERAGARPAVAGRVGDEHARVGCAAERLRDRVEHIGFRAATDRVVDHIDAVEDCVVDGRHAI
jgi:hypothetical protein